MADFFQHYISGLAPWYDLSDGRSTFGTTVPKIALDDPLLFSAVMALSAMHVSNTVTTASPKRTASSAREVAEFYHGCCIRLLIGLHESDQRLEGGVALAATCLLRSYEILDTGQDVDPNRHLRGAYSLASFPFQYHQSSISTILLDRGLFAAGFWNYLREDITFSLFRRCPLKIDLDLLIPPFSSVLSSSGHPLSDDEDHLNAISLVLGRIINAAFVPGGDSQSNGLGMKNDTWAVLLDLVKSWRAELPLHFQPFSSANVASITALPSVRLLQDCHAACHHYCLISLMILLAEEGEQSPSSPMKVQKLRSLLRVMASEGLALDAESDDLLEQLALQICGIAFSVGTSAVLVNAFGPISYASRWIRSPAARNEVAANLLVCKRSTGWPVERLVADMRSSWTRPSELPPSGEPSFLP